MKKIFAFAASLLLAVGCTAPAFEENINNNENGEYDVLYAAVDNEASKVLIDAANDLSWNAGDQISVWHNTNNKPYAFQGADGDKVGEFKYQLFGGSTTQTTFSQIYALYPYAETSAINEADETISYTIPAEQTYREGTVAAGAAVMTAIAKAGTQVNNNKNALQFKNAMSFLRVQLKGEGTVKSVAITANSGEALAGNVTISHDENNIPAFTVAEEGASSTLTLNCGEGVALDKEETTTFWMAVRPVVLATGMTVTVTTADDVYTFLVEVENLTFERNKINKITREVVRSPYKSDAAFVQSEDGETRNYTLGATTVNELSASGFKLGTGSYAGVFESAAIGVEGEKYLNFYAIPWNGKTAELYFRVNEGAAYYHALEGPTGASGNVPYTLTVGEEQHYSIKLSGLTAASVIEFSTDETFTAASNSTSGRAVLFGITLTDEALGNEITGEKPEPEPEPEPTVVKATVAEFFAAAEDDTIYELTGKITSVDNTEYGNFYLKDETGEVYIYGLCSPEGANKYWAASGAIIGDIITVQTVRTSFGGTAQGKNAIFVSLVKNENPRILSITPKTLSFDAEGGDKTVEIETFGESALNVTENADWLTVSTSANVITVTAEENTDTENDREATITITYGESTETVTVSQGKKVAAGTETTYVWTLAKNDLSTAAKTISKGEPAIDWSQTAATYIGWDSNTSAKGVQIGSSSKPATTFTLSTSGIEGTIKSIVVNASIAKSGNATLTVKVGDTAYLSGQTLTTTATDYTATVNASGDIEISFAATAKAYYLKSVTITYVK